jgi:NADH-quinone oxidoreductase subunit E
MRPCILSKGKRLRLRNKKGVRKVEKAQGKMIATVNKIDETVDRYQGDRSALIQILLDIQREYHWLPKEALLQLSERLDIPLNQIYHIATFYKAFSLLPRGRHSVTVCMGTACHVRGSPALVDKAVRMLGIKPGGTSSDMRFTLNTVNCLGCCALGPVVVVDGEYHGNPSPAELERIFEACE